MTLPMILKQLREELQIQQKELAELLGLNGTTVNRWEAGKARPSKIVCNVLLRVAKEKGASEVCLASLQDALFPNPDLDEKPNDLRYTEIDSINQLINEAPNGMIVIGLENYEILYMNDKMIEMTGVSMEEASALKCYQLLAQEEAVCDSCNKKEIDVAQISSNDNSSARYRSFHGKYYIIHTKLTTWKGQKALIKYFTDVTELLELQIQVQHQQEALNCAAQFAGMQVIQYDIQKNTATLMTTATPEAKGLPAKVENFDTAALDVGMIYPENEEQYKQMIQDIKDGKPQSEAEVQTNEPNGSSNWMHYQMNLTDRDEEGQPLTAILSARVINREKSMQERIRFEHEKVINEQKNLVAYAVYNLTENKVLEHHILSKSVVIPDSAFESYDTGYAWGSKWIVGDENQKYHLDIHKMEFLVNSFSDGITSFSKDYRMKRSDGFEVWIRNTLHLHQDIITGDIDLYEYYQSIDERKFFESFLQDNRTRAKCNIGVLRMESGQLNGYTFSETEKRSETAIYDYSTAIEVWCQRYVLPEDQNYFTKCMDLQNLRKELGEKNEYQFSYQFVSDEGVSYKKKIRFIWLDYENSICLFSSMATGDKR